MSVQQGNNKTFKLLEKRDKNAGHPEVLDANICSIPNDGELLTLTFTPDPGTLIYCNYPERLAEGVLGDKQYDNMCLNSVTINGDCQLFASHSNYTGSDKKYGVLLRNQGQTPVNVTLFNNGYRAYANLDAVTNWDLASCAVWEDFFANSGGSTFTIAPGDNMWIIEDKDVPQGGALLNCVIRFRTDGELNCFEFLYLSRDSIDVESTGLYQWDNEKSRMYRGSGNSYFITSDISLQLSKMPFYYLTSTCDRHNNNEMVGVVEPSNKEKYSADNNANLGNWGIQYEFTVRVTNDTESTQSISAFIGTPPGDPDPSKGPRSLTVINFNGIVKKCYSNPNQHWNWMNDILQSGETKEYRYQYIHAANSNGATKHSWRIGE